MTLLDLNANLVGLLKEDNNVIVENITSWMSTTCLCPVDENFKELENACPARQPNTEAVHPKWIEHHQSGHLTKRQELPSLCRRSR